MSDYSPPVIIDPRRGQPVGSQPIVQAVTNPRHVAHVQTFRRWSLIVDHSLQPIPLPMAGQQQIPQYMPTTTTAPIPIPASARSPVQPTSYIQQPRYAAQSLPMYARQPQQAGYPTSGYTPIYTYGTPATTQYAPGSVGGSYPFVQDRSPSPRCRHHHLFGHHSFFDHRHRYGHRHRHGHHHFPHVRHRTYSDPEYDYRYRRY